VLMPLPLVLRSFLALHGGASALSAVAYTLVPAGVALTFGAPSALAAAPAMQMWVRVTAAGDLLYAGLAALAYTWREGTTTVTTPQLEKITDAAAPVTVTVPGRVQPLLRLLCVYNSAHMLSFLCSHMVGPAHPLGASFYISSLLVGSAVYGYYGWIVRPEQTDPVAHNRKRAAIRKDEDEEGISKRA